MRLVWDKHNEAYDRVYVATGVRGTYRIDLDKAADTKPSIASSGS